MTGNNFHTIRCYNTKRYRMKKHISVIILASLTAGLFALPNLLKKEEFGAAAIDNLDFDLSWEDLVVKEQEPDKNKDRKDHAKPDFLIRKSKDRGGSEKRSTDISGKIR